MKLIFSLLVIGWLGVYASDNDFIKKPPLSSYCRKMIDKKLELDNAIEHSQNLIDKATRLAKSIQYDRKISQSRIETLKLKIEMKNAQLKKKRQRHYEHLLKQGCPSFK